MGDRLTRPLVRGSLFRELYAAIVGRLTFGGNIIETGAGNCRLAPTGNQQAAV